MKIDKLLYEHLAELRLRGEFDSFYAPKLQEEVDQLIQSGVLYTVLNLRLVKFINSTAIGAIIKANKRFRTEGGELAIGQPSSFCREVLTKLGIDKLVPMFEDVEAAKEHLMEKMETEGPPQVIGESNVLFTFPDAERGELLGHRSTGIGTVLSVDHERIRFSWAGRGSTRVSTKQLATLFAVDSPVHVKFQVKLCKKGFFDVDCVIESCTVTEDSEQPEVSVIARFADLSQPDRMALAQFADDLDFLKKQLKDT
ncbi:MAG: STAS domain-containing protein [Planctomycetota bacterium]